MTSFLCRALIGVLLIYASTPQEESTGTERPPIPLPSSKMLTVPSPGRIGSTNSFPATMVLSPDGHFAALLNDGYGTQETLAHQSISILNLDTNKVADFPDARPTRRPQANSGRGSVLARNTHRWADRCTSAARSSPRQTSSATAS